MGRCDEAVWVVTDARKRILREAFTRSPETRMPNQVKMPSLNTHTLISKGELELELLANAQRILQLQLQIPYHIIDRRPTSFLQASISGSRRLIMR